MSGIPPERNLLLITKGGTRMVWIAWASEKQRDQRRNEGWQITRGPSRPGI